MTTPKTKELVLDAIDLQWMSRSLEQLNGTEIYVEKATLVGPGENTFTVKRIGDDPDDRTLVIALRVPA